MDNLTHTLFAATLASAGLGRTAPRATAALIVASNIPDVDAIAGVFGGRVAYLAYHRGPTHGVAGMVALALLTALLVRRWPPADGRDARVGRLFAVSLLGTGGHLAMDWPTSYGTRLLSPFSEHWYTLDLIPIIDPFLWALLAIGVTMAWWRRRWREAIAVATLVLMAGFYGVRGWAHRRAFEIVVTQDPVAPADGSVVALPTFTSPFAWRTVSRFDDRYVVNAVDVRARTVEEVASFESAKEAPPIAWARASRTARVFLHFARFPLASVERSSGGWTVTWRDVRFLGPAMGVGRAGEPRTLFTAVVRVGADGRVLGERLGR